MANGIEERLRITLLAAYSYAANSPLSYDDPLGLCTTRTIYGLKNTYLHTEAWTAWRHVHSTTEMAHDLEEDTNEYNANSAAFAGGYAHGPDSSGGVGFGIVPWSPEKCIWRKDLIGTDWWKQRQSLEISCDCPPLHKLIPLGFRYGSTRRVLDYKTTYTDGMSNILGIWNIDCPEPQ